MASAFASGFKMGGDMYDSAERNKLLRQQEERAAKESAARLETLGLQNDAARRAATREQEAAGIRRELSDFTQGVNRPATEAALDADFEAANQAQLQGLALPAMRGGSNTANADALTVRNAVDPTNPQYRQQAAGLRSRLALATGNDRDFDAVQAAERQRVEAQQDSEFAQAVIKDPMGDAARQARTFINNQSRSLAIDTDPKTGISTFRIVKGDGTKPIEVPPADLSKIAVGVRRLQRGDVGGLDVIAGVNKELANAVREEFNIDLNVGKANNDANYKTAGLRNDTARLGIAQQQLRLQQQRYANSDAATNAAADYQRRVDGVLEGYQAAMSLGPQGQAAAARYAQEYDQLRAAAPKGLRVPPSIRALNDAQRSPQAEKATEVPERGKIMMRDGKRFMTDGLGGEVEIDARGRLLGLMPDERDAFVTETLGLPPAMANTLEFSKDGRFILAPNGAEYDTQDKNDMARIADDILAFTAQDPMEYERRMLLNRSPAPTGFGPRITYRPQDGARSIYD